MSEDFKNKLVMTAIFLLFVASIVVIIMKPIKLGLDLQGGMRLVVEAKDTPQVKVTDEAMNGVREVISNRINGLGLTEPIVQRKDQRHVVIEIPGIKDPERAIKLIGETALLEFKEAEWVPGDLSQLSEAERKEFMGADGVLDSVKYYDKDGQVIKESPIILRKTSLTGTDLKHADPSTDEYGRPVVSIEFTPEGAQKFYAVTLRSVGKPIAILLDGKIISAPNVNEAISGGRAQISGSFSIKEMQDLVIKLKAGSLPVPVEIIQNNIVGPTLGADSIARSFHATWISLALIALFMLVLYRFRGFVAMITIGMYCTLTLAALILLETTLTLPGIAGLILSIGMAVDANIIIFERLKEEIRAGLDIFAGLDASFRHAFMTIFDGNITTIIGVLPLFFWGTGSLKGFAITLSVGIVISMFTAVTVTYTFLKNAYHIKALRPKTVIK